MTPPRLSIVIPCHNDGQFLCEAVRSVQAAGDEAVELVVVDDGSSDDVTLRELAVLARQGIRVLRQVNSGPSSARNAGIAAANGEFILPLDADNRIRPAYVRTAIRILDSNPAVGVVYGDAEYFGQRSGRWTVGPFDVDRLLFWNFIDTCAVFRRRVWEDNGGYDVGPVVQGLEDWDFWLGAVERGWKFAYVPEVLFDYRVRPDSLISQTYEREDAIRAYAARKHGMLYRRRWLELAEAVRSPTSFLRFKLSQFRRRRRSRTSRP